MKPAIVVLAVLLGGSLKTLAQPAGMVKIPAGNYRPFLVSGEKRPAIKVGSFYLDVHAVTNADFLQFVRANPTWARSKVSRIFADDNYLKQWAGDLRIGDPRIEASPVTNISWFAADAYSQWKGKRLPTMVEWEYAGGAVPVKDRSGAGLTRLILEWYDHPAPLVLPPVQSTYRNVFGVFDMHGLVWEWVEDFNSVIANGAGEAGSNPFVCGAGSAGAADKEDYAAYMRFAFRQSLQASYTVGSLGFRCARDIETTNLQKK